MEKRFWIPNSSSIFADTDGSGEGEELISLEAS